MRTPISAKQVRYRVRALEECCHRVGIRHAFAAIGPPLSDRQLVGKRHQVVAISTHPF